MRRLGAARASALAAALAAAAFGFGARADGVEAELARLAALGDAAFERGDLDASASAFTTGLALAERAGALDQIPRFRRNAAVVELTRARPAFALVAFERALAELPDDDPRRDEFLISLYGDLARAAQHLGGRRRAAALLARGVELARARGDLAAEVNLGVRQVLLLATVGAREEARALALALEPLAERASSDSDRAWLASVVGGVLADAGEPEAARARFRRALELVRGLPDPDQVAWALVDYAQSLLAVDPVAAAARFDEAEAVATPRLFAVVRATIASGRGELARGAGDLDAALAFHREAGRLLERAALALDSPVRQASFARENRYLFERWIEAALARGGEAGEHEALAAAERLRRLETLDLGGAPPAGDGEPLRDGESGSAALAPGEVALVFRFVPGRLLVFVLDRERFARLELALDAPRAEALARDVALYRELVARGEPRAFRPAAARLYALLVAPLPAWARAPGRAWIVVADGPLDALPFETLVASAAAPPLLAEREIAHAPSLGWLARARRSPPPPAARTALLVAVTGDQTPDEPEVALRGALWRAERLDLGPLPAVGREAEAVARALPAGALALVGGSVSEAELAAAPFPRLGLLHFATHAFAPVEEAERAALWLGAAGDAAHDGVLEAREIAALRLSAPIVVLSACETLGVPTRDGSRGLASAFLAAGARAVVATRWRIGDASGAELVERLYRRLARGEAVGAALRGAQLELAAEPRFAAPAAWAAAVVVGDPAAVAAIPLRRPERAGGGHALVLALLAAALAGAALAARTWSGHVRRIGRR